MTTYPPLPCYPCPHASSCCAYGTTLTQIEAHDLAARYGEERVYQTRWGEWRTRVRQKRCVFLVNNACSIHADPSYPAVCRHFPWTQAETGGPYEFDRSICGEIAARPELEELGRPARRSGPTR
jgi:Fe-S-cluster containining protein